MSNSLSFADLEAQDVQLLPGRTVLSLVSLSGSGIPGTPGAHGTGHPGFGFTFGNISFPPGGQTNIAGRGIGGLGGSA